MDKEKYFPTQQFSITQTLEDLSEPEDCPSCENMTEKSIISFRIYGSNSILENSATPGYRCNRCGAELLHPTTCLESLKTVIALLDPVVDVQRITQISERINELIAELSS